MDNKERQKAIRAFTKQMANDMMSNADTLTHKGKQALLMDAVDKERMKTVQKIMLRIKREDFASRDIKSGVRFDAYGNPSVIGFMLPRHAFLAMLGVGSGHPNGSNREPFNFYNPVINKNLAALADMIAEFDADLLLNAFTTESFFKKSVL